MDSQPPSPEPTERIRRLRREVKEAPDLAAAERAILAAALDASGAERAWLFVLLPDGAPHLARATSPEPLSREDDAAVREELARVLENHARRTAPPATPGGRRARVETDDSVPLLVVAKVLRDRDAVRAIVVVGSRRLISPAGRAAFTDVAFAAAHALATSDFGLEPGTVSARPGEVPRTTRRLAPLPGSADPVLEAQAKKAKTSRLRRGAVAEARALAPDLVGESRALAKVFEEIARFAPTDLPVLVLGESGTGKELVARALHAASRRARAPFLPQNMAGLSPTLLESQLFGHEAGAFTGAGQAKLGLFRKAEGGTVFLDELGELPLELQAKLLRVLQEGKVQAVGAEEEVAADFRVIAATNRDLAREVAAGRFREDLLYRLNVLELRVPPLRERREDVPLLVERFLEGAAARIPGARPRPRFTPEAQLLLREHPFPGNVRQLQGAILRACALGRDPIPAEDLGLSLAPSGALPRAEPAAAGEDPRKAIYLPVLEEVGWNRTAAAERLGLHRNTITNALRAWGLLPPSQPRRRGPPTEGESRDDPPRAT